MTWHKFPHVPENGAHILIKFKGTPEGNYFEMNCIEGENMGVIDKWCYFEDYQNIKKRKISHVVPS